MASLLGNLRVRLTAETEDFRRGLDGARSNLQTFEKSVKKFADSTLAEIASVTALVEAIRKSIEAAGDFEKANDALAASARLAGQNLDTLKGIVAEAQEKFGLSQTMATQFAVELSKLADRAGGLKDPMRVLEAFLDLGATRGKTAAESLDLMARMVRENDKAVNEFLNRKADVYYDAFAAKIGTTVDKLSDQAKAQALVNAALQEGSGVRGEFEHWLESTEGMSFRISQGMTDASTVLGESFKPALAALVPVAKLVASAIAEIGIGITAVIADVQEVPSLAKAAAEALAGNFAAAAATFNAGEAQWRKTVADAKALVDTASKLHMPVGPLSGRGSGGETKPEDPNKAAQDRQSIYFEDSLAKAKAQHDLDLERLGTQGSVADKLQIELDLNKQIYEIKRQQVLENAKLSKDERDNALLKLRLERETSDYLARGHAANEEEKRSTEALLKEVKEKIKTIGDAFSGIIGAVASGHGVSGAQIGQNVGELAGAFLPGFLSPIASGVGGFLGGLFDKKKHQDQQNQQPIVKGLDAIERAQRETITAIQSQTDALLHPDNRLLNLPSNFAIPTYRPNVGQSVTYADSTNVTLNLTVNGAEKPADIQAAVEEAVGKVLYEQRRSMGWN